MKTTRYYPILLATILACTGQVTAENITPEDLLARATGAEAPVILDVRTREEYATGHVPDAVNIPHDEIHGRLSELDDQRDRDVVVYCRSGKRAGIATESLSRAGFRVMHLEGDMMGWIAAGHPQE